MVGDDSKKEEIEDIAEKYKQKLQDNLSKHFQASTQDQSDEQSQEEGEQKFVSQQYIDFKKEYLPKNMSVYEKLCSISEKFIKLKPGKKQEEKIAEAIEFCHLNVSPTGVNSFPYLVSLIIIAIGLLFGYMLPSVLSGGEFNSMFFVFFSLLSAMILLFPLSKIPFFMGNEWRMKASDQMVMSIFYIVTYMRHTSNLELAIDFASEHLTPPISLDFKRVIWNIETGKYESIKESLDVYLQSWKKTNMEFVEAMHLIMSSLYESSEERRIESLDKSLEVILDETYEKMLKYAHELKSPMTMITMLGVILPILSLVIAPLAINFMGGIDWYHLAAVFNLALPFGVYYLSKIALSTRPGGGGGIDLGVNPELKKLQMFTFKFLGKEYSFKPLNLALVVGVVAFLIGFSPLIIHAVAPEWDFVIGDENQEMYFLEYKEICQESGSCSIKGPFGIFSSLISLFVPLSLAFGLGLYYKAKSGKLIKIRERVQKLELEFASALFQLGNRLGDGMPAELAFARVAEVMEDTTSGDFFKEVANRITKLGMSVEQAVFDPKVGALKDFPSHLIESSMKVLSESSKKGAKIASQSLMNVSTYIKEMHRVNERVKDLMGDILSSIKGQISFLAPTLTGIVVGITSMIGTIMMRLGSMKDFMGDSGTQGAGMLDAMFKTELPTYYFQIVVGIYVVQLIYLLTVMSNTIENGKDKVGEQYSLGVNMIRSASLYIVITFIVMLVFNIIGIQILADI
ncbi:hypothetical protein GOV05_04720 [Candidatus Woesearchaeota archaeon]|nr:hypothetical protein [Candidatus Woesearchaeota archaeon]